MVILDRDMILSFMTKRRNSLYDQITRDFGGGLGGRLYAHNELKFWKEAIERGEFDREIECDLVGEVYVILSKTQPEIVDFTFYIDKETVGKRVDELNKIAKRDEYWYITLFGNHRNCQNLEENDGK